MFKGYWLKIETKNEVLAKRFVTPDSLAANAAEMLTYLQDTDPQDEFQLTVEWGTSYICPTKTGG